MHDFNTLIEEYKEIGFVTQIRHSVIHVEGLPNLKMSEIVVFETGDLGQVMTLAPSHSEILLLTGNQIKIGLKVARANSLLEIPLGIDFLGKTINPLGFTMSGAPAIRNASEKRVIDHAPSGIGNRARVNEPLVTGFTLVDLIIPLAQGQRELIIGDRKTGKSHFLLQTVLNQAQMGTICIYCLVAKKKSEIKNYEKFFQKNNIIDKTIVVATSSSDSPGLVFLTPYSAMTIAEYFRDQGKNVLLVIDDLTTHAQFYREISLLARRFPGRNAYPGDIFYIHSRLIERAGKFKSGSITVLPVAESLMGDLTGYIQTNLMAMTDGHIFFDNDYFNQGRRPAINPFLSVTRVGLQAQSELGKEISRTLSNFLFRYEKLKQLIHFGGELTEDVRATLRKGEQIEIVFDLFSDGVVDHVFSTFFFLVVWSGQFQDRKNDDLKQLIIKTRERYKMDSNVQKQITDLLGIGKLSQIIDKIKSDNSILNTILNEKQ